MLHLLRKLTLEDTLCEDLRWYIFQVHRKRACKVCGGAIGHDAAPARFYYTRDWCVCGVCWHRIRSPPSLADYVA